jgi:hypothetical protein
VNPGRCRAAKEEKAGFPRVGRHFTVATPFCNNRHYCVTGGGDFPTDRVFESRPLYSECLQFVETPELQPVARWELSGKGAAWDD